MSTNPLLSIIIPNYNHEDLLPNILESIDKLKLSSFEVIIVDDSSDRSCKEIIKGFELKGFPVFLLQAKKRLFTKNARMAGVRHAHGKYIVFADVDDVFLPNKSLETELRIIEEKCVDILHSPACIKFSPEENPTVLDWSTPFADYLEGRSIFNGYIKNRFRGHTIWGKIYRRDKWLDIIDYAEDVPIRHWREDLFLFLLYLANAKTYIGGDNVFYATSRFDLNTNEAISLIHKNEFSETAESSYILLRDFIPYLKKLGVAEDDLGICEDYFRTNIEVSLAYLTKNISYQTPDSAITENLAKAAANVSAEKLLKIFFACHNSLLRSYSKLKNELINERQKVQNVESKSDGSAKKSNVSPGCLESLQLCELAADCWPEGAQNAADLKNVCHGKRCFIIGNGQSLRHTDLSLLQNEITIGCHSIIFDKGGIRYEPTFYMAEDQNFITKNRQAIENCQSIKLMPIIFWPFFADKQGVRWFTQDRSFYDNRTFFYHRPRFSLKFDQYVFAGMTSAYTGMQLAFWLGCREIVLIGWDFDYNIPLQVKRLTEHNSDKHEKSTLEAQDWTPPPLDCILLNFKHARKVLESFGVKIWNAAQGGNLEIFDRISYMSLFGAQRQSQKR